MRLTHLGMITSSLSVCIMRCKLSSKVGNSIVVDRVYYLWLGVNDDDDDDDAEDDDDVT